MMKTIKLFFATTLIFATLPASAANTPANLAASFASQTSSLAKSTFDMAHDSVITTYIYAKLASHPELADANIDISTRQGTVMLNGIVTDDQQAQNLTHLVEGTRGVKAVDASKIIISQHESPFAIKEPVNTENVSSRIENNTTTLNIIPISQQSLSPPTDPILAESQKDKIEKEQAVTTAKEQRPAQLAESTPSQVLAPAKSKAVKLKKIKTSKIHKLHSPKAKVAARQKTFSMKKKMQLHAKAKSPHKAPHKKHPLASKTKKVQVASHPRVPQSVDKMTANFLKTALLADKPIPEE